MHRFVFAILILLMLGCDSGESGAIKYARANASGLIAETRLLWMNYKDTPGTIPESEHTIVVRGLNPKYVYVNANGVTIVTYQFFVERAGIFVRHKPSYIPPSVGDPGFTEVAPDVYWFFAPG